MAEAFGLTVTPWSPLAGGLLTGKYQNNESGRLPVTSARRTDRNYAIADAVMSIAKTYECTPAQVALAFTRRGNLNTIPILGSRTASQLEDCLGVLNTELPAEAFIELESASKIELGFPHDFLAGKGVKDIVFNQNYEKMILRK